MTRRQVGLFGGSFNPPHVCHALASVWALQTTPIEEVWWVPTYQHAFGKNLVSFEQRVEMCQLATRGLDSVMISQIERELGGESRTYDTVLALRERHPDCDFSLIVGTDILGETHKWKNWDGLMEMVELVVVGRGGFLENKTDSQTPSFSLPQVSSTAVRRALAAGQRDGILRDWMVLEVLEFIDAHGLYGGEEEPA